MTKKYRPYKLVYVGSKFDLIRTYISPIDNKISKIELEPKPSRIAYNYALGQIMLEYFENVKQEIKYFNMGNFTLVGEIDNGPNAEDLFIIPLTIYTCTKQSDPNNGIYTEYICNFRDEFTIDEEQAVAKYYKNYLLDKSREHTSYKASLKSNIELKNENTKMRELLSMYMTFANTMGRGIVVQNAYPDGMGRILDEAEMRKRAMELGIPWCR